MPEIRETNESKIQDVLDALTIINHFSYWESAPEEVMAEMWRLMHDVHKDLLAVGNAIDENAVTLHLCKMALGD